jgi:hypothetical protein
MELPERPDSKYFEVHFGEVLDPKAFGAHPIVFRVAKKAPDKMDPDVLALKVDIERTAYKIASLLPESAKRTAYISQIGNLARVGLEDGDFAIARDGLAELKQRFVVDEGVQIRRDYILKITAYSVRIGIPCLAVAIGATIALEDYPAILGGLSKRAAKFVALLPYMAWVGWGLALGVCFSAFTRNRSITFDSIGYFDQDLVDPTLRYFFLVIVGLVVSVLLANNWLIAGVTESLLLNNFLKEASVAVLLGILIGYAEPNVTRLVTETLDTIKRRTQ